jgi:hypothetical protein
VGFRMTETMTGTHEFRDGRGPAGPLPFAIEVTWGTDRLAQWIDPTSGRFLWNTLEGRVLAGGLCDWTPCRGTLALEYFARGRIRYELDLEVAGTTYRWVGEKTGIRPWNLLWTHTTCHGTLTELATGKLVSTSVVTFKLRDMPRFVLSTRWA